MKIQGDITLLVSSDGASIELRDREANITFAVLNISAADFCAALSRQAHVKCDIDLYSIDRLGKKHECKKFEFKLPDGFNRSYGEDRKAQDIMLGEFAQRQLTDGWISESYFSSQDSFFSKDGENWARVVIRRWV